MISQHYGSSDFHLTVQYSSMTRYLDYYLPHHGFQLRSCYFACVPNSHVDGKEVHMHIPSCMVIIQSSTVWKFCSL